MRTAKTAMLRYLILLVAVLVSIFPLLVMLDTVPKTDLEIAGEQQWFASHATLHYLRSTLASADLLRWLRNSTIIAAGMTVLTLALAVPAAYALARNEVMGGRAFLKGILATQTMSPAVLIVPLFILLRTVGLINSYYSVVLVGSAFVLPFSIWLLLGYFRQSSVEMEEAAALDGTVGLRYLIRFLMPCSMPGIAAVGIWCFMFGWNDFIFSLTFLSGSSSKWPITLGVFTTMGSRDVSWQSLMVVALIGTAPIMILFLLLRRHLEAGLGKTVGA